MKKLIALILILAAGAGWWFFKRGRGDEAQYLSATVTRGDMTQIVTATGTLNPVLNVTVGSQISGNIVKLFADWNSPVKAGQVVAQIDAALFQATVHQCEGDLASARAAHELAQIVAKRKQQLVGEHAAPQADLDTANATLHQTEAAVKMKEANLEQAQVNLEHCTIYSPVDGIVISRSVDVGQTVAAAMNAPVLFLVANDLAKMQIDTNVAEADVGSIEVGQDVDFTVDAFPYRTFHGKVRQNRNAAVTVQNVVTYDVVISVDNSDLKLKPGMTATVNIIIEHRENALKVPNAALRFHLVESQPPANPKLPATPTPTPPPAKKAGGGSGRALKRERSLYVLSGGGKPWAVPVKLGITDGVSTEITEGLKEGDIVITGTLVPQSSPSSPPGAQNPFSGGSRR